MGRKKYRGFNFNKNFNKNFENIRRMLGNWQGLRWFTPIRTCICCAIFVTFLISGISLYGMILIGLLLVIMQLIR